MKFILTESQYDRLVESQEVDPPDPMPLLIPNMRLIGRSNTTIRRR